MSNTRLTMLTPLLLLLAFATSGVSLAESADDGVHRVVIQVNSNDPALMNLALNNASNINKYYMEHGEEAEIRIVVFGPGLHMLRADTSPVKDRIASLSQNYDNIEYQACNNTIKGMQRKSGKDVPLISEAEVVPSGVIEIIHLQEQGWAYLKP